MNRKIPCEGRSQCARRRAVAQHGLVIDDIPKADAADFRGLQRLSDGGSWHGPVLFCPFCGRATSYAASLRAWQQGTIGFDDVLIRGTVRATP